MERYRWYHAFLFTTGDPTRAVRLVHSSTEPDDPNAQAIHGLFLYATRQFAEAERVLKHAIYLDIHCWVGNLGLALVYLAMNDFRKAFVYYRGVLDSLAEIKSPDTMPGLGTICVYRYESTTPEKKEEFLRAANTTIEAKYLSSPALQKSLIALALGDTENCIGNLEGAWRDHEPIMLWLPVWPIFDPLREQPRFEKLLGRIKLAIGRHPV